MVALHWTYYVALVIVMLAGLFINILGLPGLWVLVAGVLGYAWATDWIYIGPWGLSLLVGLGLLAEFIELVAGGAGAKKAGGGKLAALGAIIGAFLGGIFLTFLIPIPIVGTVVGVCAGAFIGAVLVEVVRGKEHEHSLRVGWAAAKGRFVGLILKSTIGVVMMGLAMWLGLPDSAKAAAAASARQLPATTGPATRALPAPATTTAPVDVPATRRTSVPSTVPTPAA